MSAHDLPPNQQLVAPGRWPVVGEHAPGEGRPDWCVTVRGCVARETVLTLDAIRDLGLVERVIDVHCVTRWSRPRMTFLGVPLSRVLSAAGDVSESARFISFIARSERGHSTSLPLEYLQQVEALVAFEADGEPLATEHGGPVRMVVPGRYFYKSLKWLQTVDVLAEDHLGFWERDSGYHNNADPWREERFVAAGISRQAAAQLIARRDFRDQDLLSIDCGDRDLDGLNAARAVLRNADFRRTSLRGAVFDAANLSGARLDGCDLSGASFRDADVEGADFRGANLSGTDFSGASFFGASFCVVSAAGFEEPATVNSRTRVDATSLDALTMHQRQFLESALEASS